MSFQKENQFRWFIWNSFLGEKKNCVIAESKWVFKKIWMELADVKTEKEAKVNWNSQIQRRCNKLLNVSHRCKMQHCDLNVPKFSENLWKKEKKIQWMSCDCLKKWNKFADSLNCTEKCETKSSLSNFVFLQKSLRKDFVDISELTIS